jgi:hypothetical protein
MIQHIVDESGNAQWLEDILANENFDKLLKELSDTDINNIVGNVLGASALFKVHAPNTLDPETDDEAIEFLQGFDLQFNTNTPETVQIAVKPGSANVDIDFTPMSSTEIADFGKKVGDLALIIESIDDEILLNNFLWKKQGETESEADLQSILDDIRERLEQLEPTPY